MGFIMQAIFIKLVIKDENFLNALSTNNRPVVKVKSVINTKFVDKQETNKVGNTRIFCECSESYEIVFLVLLSDDNIVLFVYRYSHRNG